VRTTLNIDDDVLSAVRERARDEKRSSGEVLSDLARQTLIGGRPSHGSPAPEADDDRYTIRNGFRVLRSRGGIVTNEIIDRIRDEEGI
jgi:hypothetical protein